MGVTLRLEFGKLYKFNILLNLRESGLAATYSDRVWRRARARLGLLRLSTAS